MSSAQSGSNDADPFGLLSYPLGLGTHMIPEIQQHRQQIAALCREYGVLRLELFGSAAAGGYRPDSSDLDFLVEFDSQSSSGYADRYFGLLESLQDLFGRPVDLVVGSAIKNPYFRQSVDSDKALLYAA